jgi:hypothetical protein
MVQAPPSPLPDETRTSLPPPDEEKEPQPSKRKKTGLPRRKHEQKGRNHRLFQVLVALAFAIAIPLILLCRLLTRESDFFQRDPQLPSGIRNYIFMFREANGREPRIAKFQYAPILGQMRAVGWDSIDEETQRLMKGKDKKPDRYVDGIWYVKLRKPVFDKDLHLGPIQETLFFMRRDGGYLGNGFVLVEVTSNDWQAEARSWIE